MEEPDFAEHIAQAPKDKHRGTNGHKIDRRDPLDIAQAYGKGLLHHGKRHVDNARIKRGHEGHDQHGKQNRPFVLAMGIALKGNAASLLDRRSARIHVFDLAASILCGRCIQTLVVHRSHLLSIDSRTAAANTQKGGPLTHSSMSWEPAFGSLLSFVP